MAFRPFAFSASVPRVSAKLAPWPALCTQTRTHNAQNEITGINGAVVPTYDANGNLTRDEVGRQFVYDAWNRLVEVRDGSGETVKRYAYDGLHRRISETAGGVTTDFYSSSWQVLEERVGGNTIVQYVWSPVYVDAMVLRDRDTDGDGTLDERLWVVQDANYNVTALLDNAGNVVERYVYDPFGQATVLDTNWNVRSGGSAYDWLYLHQGGRFDTTSGLYHFRFRAYSPTLGRWTSLDPLRFDAGDVNLYRVVFNAPTVYTDPTGQAIFIVLGIAVVGAALLNTNTGAEAVVTAGNFITGGSFSGWVAGPSNDRYGRFAHRVDQKSLPNQLGGLVGITSVGGSIRVPKKVKLPGAPSTTSIWTKVPGISLATGQALGRLFSGIVLIEGVYNIVVISDAFIDTFIDGEEE